MNKLMCAQARLELLESLQAEYQAGNWKLKYHLLNTFVIATGYERKHATKLLNDKIQRAVTPNKRGNAACYGEEVVKVLELPWHASNRICSKRLVPFIPELLAILE